MAAGENDSVPLSREELKTLSERNKKHELQGDEQKNYYARLEATQLTKDELKAFQRKLRKGPLAGEELERYETGLQAGASKQRIADEYPAPISWNPEDEARKAKNQQHNFDGKLIAKAVQENRTGLNELKAFVLELAKSIETQYPELLKGDHYIELTTAQKKVVSSILPGDPNKFTSVGRARTEIADFVRDLRLMAQNGGRIDDFQSAVEAIQTPGHQLTHETKMRVFAGKTPIGPDLDVVAALLKRVQDSSILSPFTPEQRATAEERLEHLDSFKPLIAGENITKLMNAGGEGRKGASNLALKAISPRKDAEIQAEDARKQRNDDGDEFTLTLSDSFAGKVQSKAGGIKDKRAQITSEEAQEKNKTYLERMAEKKFENAKPREL